VRYAAATVAGLTSSSSASARTGGSFASGPSPPSAISSSTADAIAAAPGSEPIRCTSLDAMVVL
jgi:hypothetical protein